MKQQIFNNWNLGRFLRLALGVFIIAQSIIQKEWLMGVLGILFSLMPVLNIGCCGAGGCATAPPKRTGETIKDITYEEVV